MLSNVDKKYHNQLKINSITNTIKLPNIDTVREKVNAFLNPLGYSANVETVIGGEIHIEPSTKKVGKNRPDFFDGMQIHLFKDGTYEVSEYQAGKNKDELYIYKETPSLIIALKELIKGNNRKPIKKYAKGGELKMALGGTLNFKPITTPL